MGSRRARAVATGAILLAVLIAAPAIAGAGQNADPGKQPPPGTSVPKAAEVTRGQQPAADQQVPKKTDYVAGQQPVNRHPEQAGPPLGLQHSQRDLGEKRLAATPDRGE
jgi:hypothetical protein